MVVALLYAVYMYKYLRERGGTERGRKGEREKRREGKKQSKGDETKKLTFTYWL